MRNIYERSKIGKLTQGSIITGCIADNFPGDEVFGCIITPRCDLSHKGKVTTVHYLPVVPFEKWFEIMAVPIIFEQWKNDIKGFIDNSFSDFKLGSHITSLDLSKDDLLKLIPSDCKEKKMTSLIKKIDDYYSVIQDENFKEYLSSEKGKHIDYLKQLKENKIPSCYLIESWSKNNTSDYYVIMLRDVRRLSINVAERISNGLFEKDISPIDHSVDDLYSSSNNDIMYYVESQIASPFIEHILQAFIYNFNRIGVEDSPITTFENLTTIISTIYKQRT